MRSLTSIGILVIVGASIVFAGYDVNQEIEELKKRFGDKVHDVPCSVKKGTCLASSKSKNKDKRFLFGSDDDHYCHDKLGCFPTDGAFSERPVNLNPNARETINTQFTLYTRNNRKTGQKLVADNSNTLYSSLFNPDRKTKFVIHGFLESSKAIWFDPMNEQLLKNGDYNVINVDWGGLRGSKTLYTQATANTRVVAAEIVYLLKSLVKIKSLSLADVHLIGHSLGSHISGYVGKNFSAAIGRITGLDPAEPYFQGYDAAIRLDPTDAKFVDVIHSDADSITEIVKGEGGFGSKELSGHADFFPNGGEDQPNCKNGIVTNVKLQNDLYEGLKRFFACDHDRAVLYFTESINDCKFTGTLCSDYKEYENGKCSISCNSQDSCNSMGFGAYKPQTGGYKKYYLHTTGIDGNFCATGYQVTVTMEDNSQEYSGTLDVTVLGTSGEKKVFHLNKEKNKLNAGGVYTYVVGIGKNLGQPDGLKILWKRDLSWWQVVSKACGYLSFCNNSIKIKEVKLTSSEGKSSYFCGSGQTLVSERETSLFYSQTKC